MNTQKISSAGTSMNKTKVPKLFTLAAKVFQDGSHNLDYGAGKFNTAAEFLATLGVANSSYDPFNRPKEENDRAMEKADYDTVTLSNVLNVVGPEEARRAIVQDALDHLKPGGILLIKNYSGDNSGKPKLTRSGCMQTNMNTRLQDAEIAAWELDDISFVEYKYTVLMIHKRYKV